MSSCNCSNCNRESETFRNEFETLSRESENCQREQHVHELLGSTLSAGRCNACHSHRFATVSEEAIRSGNSHVHKVTFRTDSTDGHFHEFCGTTGPAVFVGGGRHVHYLSECTDTADGHTHRFRAATLINDPTGEETECRCNCR